MNLKEIKEMIQLMNENGLTELDIEKDDIKVRLKKTAAGFVMEPLGGPGIPEPPKPAPPPAARNLIKSPMVGTFYRTPAPDAPPFVEVGQDIEVGQVVCIIEATKLMNEIKSEAAGRVAEVLAQNGDPVEFGQPLFSIEPPA